MPTDAKGFLCLNFLCLGGEGSNVYFALNIAITELKIQKSTQGI